MSATNRDFSCGFWIFRCDFLQKFANQTTYMILYGIVGCILSMTSAYFNGTISTLEKRFKISSQNMGIISMSSNISQMIVPAVLSYYAGRASNRPRWIGIGLLIIVLFCLLNATPHFLYGAGEVALAYAIDTPHNNSEATDTVPALSAKSLCRPELENNECVPDDGSLAPQIIFGCAQFLSGIGSALFYTLGVSYLDDNAEKKKVPALLSLSFFINMLGPSVGYALASFCLRIFIDPGKHSIISTSDPRWLGAWWIGWLFLGGIMFILSILFLFLPAQLSGLRRKNTRETDTLLVNSEHIVSNPPMTASFRDMIITFKRLISNKTLMFNNFSSIFYFFGYTPYWIFTTKYIEIQYNTSASASSMATGSTALIFTAMGILFSGLIISKFRLSARMLLLWNIIVGVLTVLGMLSYVFIGCSEYDSSKIVNLPDENMTSCNSQCHCDFVQYDPVCGSNGKTYISACHAGCKGQESAMNGEKFYTDCSCVTNIDAILDQYEAKPGSCSIACQKEFIVFIIVMCCLKFLGSSSRVSNLLLSMRCIPEADKTAALGLGMMMISLLTFMPSPILFGWILDKTCLVWGRTCTNKGNCWLYDSEILRYTLNITAAAFVLIGVFFDCGIWYHVKNIKIFDESIYDGDIEMEMHRTKKSPNRSVRTS